MKKNLFIATILFIMVNQAKSQQQASSPFPKTITVTGSAEKEIIPDEIYVMCSFWSHGIE